MVRRSLPFEVLGRRALEAEEQLQRKFILVSFPISDAYFIQNVVSKSFPLNGAFCDKLYFQIMG